MAFHSLVEGFVLQRLHLSMAAMLAIARFFVYDVNFRSTFISSSDLDQNDFHFRLRRWGGTTVDSACP